MIDIVRGLRRIAEEGYRFAGDAADEIERLRASLEEAEAECFEQARLNGMGSEREAALMAKLEMAERGRDDVAQQLVQAELGKRKLDAECDELYAKVEAMEREREALHSALEKIADWYGVYGPYPETNEAWRAMAVVTAREIVPQEGISA